MGLDHDGRLVLSKITTVEKIIVIMKEKKGR